MFDELHILILNRTKKLHPLAMALSGGGEKVEGERQWGQYSN
jgi:hypothetical protein